LPRLVALFLKFPEDRQSVGMAPLYHHSEHIGQPLSGRYSRAIASFLLDGAERSPDGMCQFH